jgi:hypothetical protein
MSEDENTLFHLWLEQAVCRASDDPECEAQAVYQEMLLRGLVTEMPDAGLPDAGEPDAGEPDAGRRRRGRRMPGEVVPSEPSPSE